MANQSEGTALGGAAKSARAQTARANLKSLSEKSGVDVQTIQRTLGALGEILAGTAANSEPLVLPRFGAFKVVEAKSGRKVIRLVLPRKTA